VLRTAGAEKMGILHFAQDDKFFMNTAEQTLDEILKLAAAHFKVPREELRPDDDFFKTLGIDSLQTLDLLTKLENHFRVELPDYELQGVSDFRTLAGKIQARL
jgi:acyl carrier protein